MSSDRLFLVYHKMSHQIFTSRMLIHSENDLFLLFLSGKHINVFLETLWYTVKIIILLHISPLLTHKYQFVKEDGWRLLLICGKDGSRFGHIRFLCRQSFCPSKRNECTYVLYIYNMHTYICTYLLYIVCTYILSSTKVSQWVGWFYSSSLLNPLAIYLDPYPYCVFVRAAAYY